MRFNVPLAALAFAAATTVATFAIGQDDPITARQAIMKSNAAQATTVGAMIKGEAPWDATAAAAAMNQIVTNMTTFPTLFPEGSDSGDTRALPAIWQNKADFEAHAAKLATDAKAAADAAATSQEAFTAAFATVGQDCGACHQLYRKS
jgi:cytochrome c556